MVYVTSVSENANKQLKQIENGMLCSLILKAGAGWEGILTREKERERGGGARWRARAGEDAEEVQAYCKMMWKNTFFCG